MSTNQDATMMDIMISGIAGVGAVTPIDPLGGAVAFGRIQPGNAQGLTVKGSFPLPAINYVKETWLLSGIKFEYRTTSGCEITGVKILTHVQGSIWEEDGLSINSKEWAWWSAETTGIPETALEPFCISLTVTASNPDDYVDIGRIGCNFDLAPI